MYRRDFEKNIKYLNEELQNWLIDICKHVDEKYGHNESFKDYPMTDFPTNTYYYCTDVENEVNNYNTDDEMKEYLQMLLDEMKNKNDKKE
jgi:hypothetical protein